MPSSWTGLGTSLAVDTEIFTSAPYALKLTPATGSYSYVISERAEIRPGTDYVVSAWVRTEGNDEYTDFLPIRWFNGSSFMQQSGPVAPGDDPEWSAISQTVTAPDEATHADVAFFMQSQQGAVWIDDVSLKADGADEELLTNPSFDQ